MIASPNFCSILVTWSIIQAQGDFAEAVKVTNNTGLWDVELAWYAPIRTRRICRGCEGDEPHWTVWCRAHLILTNCYSSDLPRPWGWRTTLDWDVVLAWPSPIGTRRICRGLEGDELHLTVRCRARLTLSNWYSSDLPRPWRWRTTLDCEMPCSPDPLQLVLVGFAEVVKVTNHTGLCDAELTWYSPIATLRICRGRKGDEQHWTEMPCSPDTLQLVLVGFAEASKVTNYTGLWDAVLAWYSTIATLRICRDREGDELHWTVRCRARLNLSNWYSSDLPRPWRWRTTLDCVMPCSPDPHQLLLFGFAEAVRVANNTGLRCRARLTLSNWYSSDLPRPWRWRTTLDCEMLLTWFAVLYCNQLQIHFLHIKCFWFFCGVMAQFKVVNHKIPN